MWEWLESEIRDGMIIRCKQQVVFRRWDRKATVKYILETGKKALSRGFRNRQQAKLGAGGHFLTEVSLHRGVALDPSRGTGSSRVSSLVLLS